MWQRLNGKKKLKKDAVPTIFAFFIKKNVVDNNISNNHLIINECQDMECDVSLKILILQ